MATDLHRCFLLFQKLYYDKIVFRDLHWSCGIDYSLDFNNFSIGIYGGSIGSPLRLMLVDP